MTCKVCHEKSTLFALVLILATFCCVKHCVCLQCLCLLVPWSTGETWWNQLRSLLQIILHAQLGGQDGIFRIQKCKAINREQQTKLFRALKADSNRPLTLIIHSYFFLERFDKNTPNKLITKNKGFSCEINAVKIQTWLACLLPCPHKCFNNLDLFRIWSI